MLSSEFVGQTSNIQLLKGFSRIFVENFQIWKFLEKIGKVDGEYLLNVYCMQLYYGLSTCMWRILGECLLISSLPGKASRTLVDIASLPSDSTYVLEAKPGKHDIKRREPGSIYQLTKLIHSSN